MLGRLRTAFLLFAAIHGIAQQTKCVLEGTAVDFTSAEPLRKTTVRLIPSTYYAPGQMAITDASGHFHFENVPAGEYELTGERTGYLKSEFGARQPGGNGTTLHLKPGNKLTGLILKLAPCSVITGKVTDESGEPISKALVYAVSRTWIRGQHHYDRSEGGWTNDAGEYRIIDLPPGHYYLGAETSPQGFVDKQGGAEKQILPAFYPDSRTLDGALLLDVQPGQSLPGLNFELHAGRVFHIRGKLAGNLPIEGLTLNGHPHNLGDGIMDLESEQKAGGSFDFSGVPAGNYDLELLNEEYKQIVAKVPVEVKNSDVNGVIVPVPKRFEVKGVIHLLETSSAALSQFLVIAADAGSPLMSHPYQASVEPDGKFTIGSVWPGKYLLGCAAGQGNYVKSIEYGGQEVLGVPVDLITSAGQIEVTVSGGAGRIDGSVQAPDSGASIGGLEVVLASEAPRSDYYGVLLAKSDQDGQFSFKNVPPGKYQVFAVADVEAGLLENRSFINQFQENGIEVDLPENGNLQIHVPIVSSEDVQRALDGFWTMKRLACALLFATALTAQSPCAIRGTVVDALNSQPVARAQVFASADSDADDDDAAAPPVRQITDAHGSFCFENLAEGDYVVTAKRARYIDASFGEHWPGGSGHILEVAAGEPVAPITIEMAPQAVISGVLLDGEGDPVQGAPVDLQKPHWKNRRLTAKSVQQTTTDDQGRYRFAGLVAGSYFVSTIPARDGASPARRMFLDQSGQPFRQVEGKAYYKDSISLRDATPIRVWAGQEVSNLMLILRKVEARHVSGEVVPGVLTRILGLSQEDSGFLLTVPIQNDGRFLADGLFPDSYVLQGPSVARKEIDLTNGDIDGVVLERNEPIELQITVHLAGTKVQSPIRNLVLVDRTHENAQFQSPQLVSENRFKSLVPPGQYGIGLPGEDPPYFFNGLTIDGEPQPGPILDLKGGGRKVS